MTSSEIRDFEPFTQAAHDHAHPAATSLANREASLTPLPHAGGVGGGPPRLNTFHPAKMALFLRELAGHGNVRRAAASAGISAQSAYVWRRRDGRFAGAWDAALVLAHAANEQLLADRAWNGVEEPVYYRGELVGSRVRFDGRLLLAHLARLDRKLEEMDERAEERAGRFDELVALVAGAEPPEAIEVPGHHDPDTFDPLLPLSREWHVRYSSQYVRGEAKQAAAAEAAGAEWDCWDALAADTVDRLGSAEAVPVLEEAAPQAAETPALPFEVKSLGGIAAAAAICPLDSVNRVNLPTAGSALAYATGPRWACNSITWPRQNRPLAMTSV